jgi:nitrite reductase/ring-hydroxylating ferredoxin subunit/Fe-S cluster biogenesis protein NfuA
MTQTVPPPDTLVPEADSLEALAARVDQAVNEARKLDDNGRIKALDLKRAVEEFHKAALTRMVRQLKADPRGLELLLELANDPLVYALFAMHGIVRADIGTRAARVLEMVRPYMQGHGGDVELVEVRGDTVFVRLMGACNGCSMSAVTLREGVEEALKSNIPEIKQVEVVPNEPGPALITLDSIGVTSNGRAGWVKGPSVAELPPGTMQRLDSDECSILLVNIDNQLSAFRNACAHQGLPLDGGELDAATGHLTCPWHGFCFDARSGECITAPAAQLEAFPLRVEDGHVWVRPTAR